MIGGYLFGVVLIGFLKVIPFIRVGDIEIRGNVLGVIFGAILGVLCARSTYKAHIRKQSDDRT